MNWYNQKYFKFYLIILLVPFAFFTNQSMVNAEEATIPDWVWGLYYFWTDELITDTELVNALGFLEDQKIIDLIFHKKYDVKTSFLLSILESEKHDRLHELNICSSDWYITGYFIPVESDYSGRFSRIFVDNDVRQFRADFVKAVKIEGWGKTSSGDYLGWYDKSYHLSDSALDSVGESLSLSSVAVDPSIIDENSELFIPSLPEPWGNLVFTANDIGPSIQGKHIDVFTGEGKIAEEETYSITGYENEVCSGN